MKKNIFSPNHLPVTIALIGALSAFVLFISGILISQISSSSNLAYANTEQHKVISEKNHTALVLGDSDQSWMATVIDSIRTFFVSAYHYIINLFGGKDTSEPEIYEVGSTNTAIYDYSVDKSSVALGDTVTISMKASFGQIQPIKTLLAKFSWDSSDFELVEMQDDTLLNPRSAVGAMQFLYTTNKDSNNGVASNITLINYLTGETSSYTLPSQPKEFFIFKLKAIKNYPTSSIKIDGGENNVVFYVNGEDQVCDDTKITKNPAQITFKLPKVADPVLSSTNGNPFVGSTTITANTTTTGAVIRYTTNNTTPTATSTQFPATGLNLTATTSIKAVAFYEGWEPSNVVSVTYTKEARTGDVTNDNYVDMEDLIAVLQDWATYGITTLITILNNWYPKP